MSDKPCPLCGREMTAIETHARRGELYCVHCDLTIGANEAKTPDELMELLEQRMCHDKGYIDDGEWYFVCSDCGCEFEYTDFACEFADGRRLGSPNFCPNCGRRIEVTA